MEYEHGENRRQASNNSIFDSNRSDVNDIMEITVVLTYCLRHETFERLGKKLEKRLWYGMIRNM